MLIGMLGGGQLGRLFIQEARRHDIEVDVLETEDHSSPCESLARTLIYGDCMNEEDVYNFGKNYDIIICEKEQVNVQALYCLNKERWIIPDPTILELSQNKYEQKLYLLESFLPTPRFVSLENNLNVGVFGFPFYQKLNFGGYDGRGVVKINSPEEVSWKMFSTTTSFLEEAINIEKEISIIIARDTMGDIKIFPAIEMVFDNELSILDYTHVPGCLTIDQERLCRSLAITLVQYLDFVGIMAIEMFLTKEGDILINEFSPRFHNSGHWTIEGCLVSQYRQMCNIIQKKPLINTDVVSSSLTFNILGKGEKDYDDISDWYFNLPPNLVDNMYVHWYNKKALKNRKIGHITLLGKNVLKRYEEIQRYIRGEL